MLKRHATDNYMKIKASYSECTITFKELLKSRDCFGEFHFNDKGECFIDIHKDLTGNELIVTILHELGHWAWHIWKPKKEEFNVTVLSSFYVEVFTRNKRLWELILKNI